MNPDRVDVSKIDGPVQASVYDPARYGDTHAEVYDEIYAGAFPTDQAVRRLVELAATRPGPLLDLGIGTGRLALPLYHAGVEIHGIDSSTAMIARLRGVAAAEEIPVWQADIADFEVAHRYAVIILAVSTLFMLPDRAAQMKCLRCAARHLLPDGLLVIEAFVPNPRRYDTDGHRIELRHLDDTGLHLVLSQHQPTQQAIEVIHVLAGPNGMHRYQVQLNYAWPLELDLMATLAGLELLERAGGWDHQPYDQATVDHVTIYHKPVIRP